MEQEMTNSAQDLAEQDSLSASNPSARDEQICISALAFFMFLTSFSEVLVKIHIKYKLRFRWKFIIKYKP